MESSSNEHLFLELSELTYDIKDDKKYISVKGDNCAM